jgi:hypothetical protein
VQSHARKSQGKPVVINNTVWRPRKNGFTKVLVKRKVRHIVLQFPSLSRESLTKSCFSETGADIELQCNIEGKVRRLDKIVFQTTTII